MSKYECNLCNYDSKNKTNFIKHCNTKKHITMMKKNKLNYIYLQCVTCNFLTTDSQAIENHVKETSHKIKTVCKFKQTDHFKCDKCGKQYKYASGIYRHQKKCMPVTSNNNHMMDLLKKTTEINNKLCEKIVDLENNRITNYCTNITNNNLDIHLYLNSEFKNAMNLSEFIDKIKLSLDDLLYTKANGYVEGITNIFVKNLNYLEPKERPIYSIQDNQSRQFYIKDKTGWECDKKEEQLDNTIESVSKKQFNKIKEWEAKHLNWSETEEGIDEYIKMVKNIMGGTTDSERIENKIKIKKQLKKTINMEI